MDPSAAPNPVVDPAAPLDERDTPSRSAADPVAKRPSPEAQAIGDIIAEVRALLDQLGAR